MKKLNILLTAGMMLALAACKKSETLDREIVGLGGDTWVNGPLDSWLSDNFTKPFNIDVKYRWDGSELDLSKTLVPPRTEKVQPVMEIVKAGWIDVYTAEAGLGFIKQFAPRQYLLVGSLQYNSGGTVTLGEAEGGNRVTLFNINNFVKTDRNIIKPVLKTIHHEFTHILNQTISYAKEFEKITPAGYTADWNNTTLANANAAGYISQYAQAAPGEDYAEMTSIMLTEGKSAYDAKVNSIVLPKIDSIPDPANPPFIIQREIPNATAQAFIRKKEESVITYFKQSYGIDFAKLRNRTNYALAENAPINLATIFGNGRQFTSLSVDPTNNAGMSAAFMSTWATAKAGLAALPSPVKTLNSFVVFFYPKAGELVLRVNYTSGTTATVAHFVYKAAYDANRNMTLTYVRRDTNGNTIAPGIVALTNYLTTGSFGMNYRYDANLLEYGQWFKTSDANSSFFGTLGVIKY
ncbi:putative zinc-binding metallopeptidase [Pedobacter sp. N36a]|uniref:zinc-binding metallopeptidase n=1 Tax=Pedobacter sp. N36a TaxID=2767996 RepID=UPI001656F6DF|nr:putative zinc-binding metallopeptidase [Pedobacter sp. N36a]MBC8987105.1 putative zinc-binding metallopeptidase [Pedobacter sp. N36a]